MRILSLWQPWASLVALGHKTIETRGHGTSYRGPLLIHATKARGAETEAAIADVTDRLLSLGLPALPDRLPYGAVVCLCDLAGCWRVPGHDTPLFDPGADALYDSRGRPVSTADRLLGNLAPGRYGWDLEHVRPLPEPIPWKGTQGLMKAHPLLVRKVREQLGITES